MKKYISPDISVESIKISDVVTASLLGFVESGEGEYTSWNDIFKS